MSAKVLVLGGGGREHALVWKLSQSQHVGKIFVSPGNAGTTEEAKTENIALNISDHSIVEAWCRGNGIDLVVIGPEAPLADGITFISDFVLFWFDLFMIVFGPGLRIESFYQFPGGEGGT